MEDAIISSNRLCVSCPKMFTMLTAALLHILVIVSFRSLLMHMGASFFFFIICMAASK